MPICNICSIFEEDEESPNWKAGSSVAHCLKCKNYQGLSSEMQSTQSQKTTNSSEDFVLKIEQLKDVLRSPSLRSGLLYILSIYCTVLSSLSLYKVIYKIINDGH